MIIQIFDREICEMRERRLGMMEVISAWDDYSFSTTEDTEDTEGFLGLILQNSLAWIDGRPEANGT